MLTGLLMRGAHVRRRDLVTYGEVAKPPKPGVSRWRTFKESEPPGPEQPYGLTVPHMLN